MGYSQLAGAEGFGELGWRADETWSLYGRGYVRQGDAGVMAGVRARW